MSKKSGKSKSGESATYETKDIVLAKLRGFPSWPAQIVDEDAIPPAVMKERPTTKKTKFYCVRFFPAGDFAWSVAKDLSMLHKHEIESYINEPHKKSGDLLEGYKIALDPDKWLEEKDAERKAAEKEEDDAEVDQLEGEDEADNDGEGEKKSKKRKRETEGKTKSKKANGTTGEKKKRASKKATSKSEGVESEDEAGATKTPATKKAKKDKKEEKEEPEDPQAKKVKDWRHALQRIFLNKTPPKAEDMPQHEKLFAEVESYDSLTVEHLTHSKIGKVMRHIAALDPAKIPRDDEFKIRDRANALVEKWHKIVGTSAEAQTNGDVSKMDVDAPETAVNGPAEE